MEKVQEIDSHVGVAISGLAADARSLVDHARVEAASHRFSYDEPLRVESLTQSICDLKMSFGEGGDDDDDEDDGGDGGGGRKKAKMSRPFGVSLLVAGCDARGPQLYCTDPSGTYVAWDAQAIGNGSEAARTILQERYAKAMTLEAAAALLVRVLSETMEEKVRRRGELGLGVFIVAEDIFFCSPPALLNSLFPLPVDAQITSGNVELACVTPAEGWHLYDKAQLDAVIAKVHEEMAAEGAR